MKDGIKEKIKGNANQAIGKSKAVIGKMFDDKELEAKGRAQNIKGSGQEFIGDAKDTLKKGAEVVGEKMDQLKDKLTKVTKK